MLLATLKPQQVKAAYFLTINDGTGQMSLIIFESQLAQLKDNGIDIESYKGKKVSVAGTVTEYNSQLELILSSGDAIKIV